MLLSSLALPRSSSQFPDEEPHQSLARLGVSSVSFSEYLLRQSSGVPCVFLTVAFKQAILDCRAPALTAERHPPER